MRKLVPDMLSADEANSLMIGNQSFDNPLVKRVISHMPKAAAIVSEAIARVEDHKPGHPWHLDTGDANQMPWCRFTASTLLSPVEDFTGGMFYFKDPPAQHKKYLASVIFDLDNEHMVDPHEGVRKVLLIFLGAQDGQ